MFPLTDVKFIEYMGLIVLYWALFYRLASTCRPYSFNPNLTAREAWRRALRDPVFLLVMVGGPAVTVFLIICEKIGS